MVFLQKKRNVKIRKQSKKYLTLFFFVYIQYGKFFYGGLLMGKAYKCIEGKELGHLGGSWFASYAAFDVNCQCSSRSGLPLNSLHWNQRQKSALWAKRFRVSQLWVLMPNGVVDKTSRTKAARNRLIKQGGMSIHAYWALWILRHCSAQYIAKNRIGLSFATFKNLLQGSLPFL